MKKFALSLFLYLSMFQYERLFAYETTMLGDDLNRYNFFEHVKDCFDENKLGQIIQENQNNDCRFEVIYDLEGTLKSFFLDSPYDRYPDYQYFTEGNGKHYLIISIDCHHYRCRIHQIKCISMLTTTTRI